MSVTFLNTGPQHLPPLGQKDRRQYPSSSSLQLSPQQRLWNRKFDGKKHEHGFSSPSVVTPGSTDGSSARPGVVPAPGWTAFADIFVQAGQAAGIAFQWMETETMPLTTGAAAIAAATAAVVAGLTVVGVADGSLAATHGGISPGMVLLEINRKRVFGLDQDQVMRLMRASASQSRVLTLARVATLPLPSPSPSAIAPSNSRTEARPISTTHEQATALSPFMPNYPSLAINPDEDVRTLSTPSAAAAVERSSSGQSALANSRPHSSALSSVDNDDGDASLAASSSSALFSPFFTSNKNTKLASAGTPSSPLSSCSYKHHQRVSSSSPSQRLIALRFVGSRGDMTLFDRDHVLGLKTRDIEFVPQRTKGGGGVGGLSHSSKIAAQFHRANSQRSLKDLTRDWRNDPFSTPARRRRLINDVCKVIVRSYTHASASRVAALRREESFITRIQATLRMRSARRLFREKLAKRRVEAASVLQLGWLSCTARRRVGVLREEKDHERRVEKDRRERRQAWERKERRRREEEEREREREERESKRRKEMRAVVFVQRRFRAMQEVCGRCE